MLEPAVTMNSEGVVKEWTPLAESLFGYTSEQAVDQPLGNLIVPEPMRPYHEMGLRRYVETRDPRCVGHVVEIEALHKDGGDVPIEMRIDAVDENEELLFKASIAAR